MPVWAIGLAAIASAGASTATGIYGQRKAAQENAANRLAQERDAQRAERLEKRSQVMDFEKTNRQIQAEKDAQAERLAAEQRALETSLALEREKEARRERQYQSVVDLDRQRWDAYVEANRPSWDLGGRVLGNLFDLAGYGGGVPSGSPGTFAPPPQMSAGGFAPASPGSAPGSVATLADLMGRAAPAPPARAAVPNRQSGYRRQAFPTMAAPRATGGMSLADVMSLASYASPTTSGYRGVGSFVPARAVR